MKINKLFLSAITVLCVACADDYDLKSSVFVYDKENPGLPRYSEMGYNTFGSYYDRLPFISGDETPVEVIVNETETLFSFKGKIGTSLPKDMALTITVNDLSPDTYTDLLSLHQMSIDLTDPTYTISIRDAEGLYNAEILNGTFKFERVQTLQVDKELFQVILSGTFDFQAVINNEPVTVSNGRFDVGVGDHNFYNFE
ncbi:MAG TPA: hypothetical protein VGK59_11115 [Ohtaekwangia sp.]